MRLDPHEALAVPLPKLRRPAFLAIVASASLASMLQRKSNGRVDGFVVEGPTAGGHNAPPRGRMQLDDSGQPIYGERDIVDPAEFVALGQPFWLAGSHGTPEGLRAALAAGATGVQAGTAFAFCEESGIAPELKRGVLDMARSGTARVITDPLASPTGFPFSAFTRAASAKGPRTKISTANAATPKKKRGYTMPRPPMTPKPVINTGATNRASKTSKSDSTIQ